MDIRLLSLDLAVKIYYEYIAVSNVFPAIILLVPRYMIAKPMANKYVGMIIPLSISVWAIFMYINYFRTLPDAVFEAARIDGASNLRIIATIAFL